ncbi:MAG: tRNA pseudouridine(55) synthase TruB [Lachnospirales bacterium]
MKSNETNLSGVINIYKEKGYTSHDVVNIVRKCLGRIKTGHTGTLDPDAEGVLPICIGKATKLADYIQADIKEYKAEILLGITTTTEDVSGDIIEKKEVSVSEKEVKEVILSFIGDYNQKPPMYSAIKVNGKKLYELAREGKEIERKTRLIHIYNISNINYIENNKYEFTVLCSKGTYIRTLCKDIGEKLGCGACMSALTRTRTGNFYIKDSIKIDDFKKAVESHNFERLISSPDKVLNYNKITVSSQADKFLYNGNRISKNFVKGEISDKNLVYDSYGNLIGIYEDIGDFIKPITMLR